MHLYLSCVHGRIQIQIISTNFAHASLASRHLWTNNTISSSLYFSDSGRSVADMEVVLRIGAERVEVDSSLVTKRSA